MGTTPNLGLPYPELSDTPDVPRDIRALALAVDQGAVRVTHPNTDDVLVQAWDAGLGRWQTVHYDSGERSIASTHLEEGFTGNVYIRNVNGIVTLRFAPITRTSAGGPRNDTRILKPLGPFWSPRSYPSIPIAPFADPTNAASIGWSNGPTDQVRFYQSGVWAANDTLWSQVTYGSGDSIAIPTSLPGVLVRPAPAAAPPPDAPEVLPE